MFRQESAYILDDKIADVDYSSGLLGSRYKDIGRDRAELFGIKPNECLSTVISLFLQGWADNTSQNGYV